MHPVPVATGPAWRQGTHSGVCVPRDTRDRGVRCTWASVPPRARLPAGTGAPVSMGRQTSVAPVKRGL